MSNEHEEKSVVLNFLAGMGLGALVGATAALLLAPKSGNETRQDIVNATEDLKVKASKAMQDISRSSEELVQKSKDLMESTKTKVQNAVDAGKQAMTAKKEQLSGEGEE